MIKSQLTKALVKDGLSRSPCSLKIDVLIRPKYLYITNIRC